MVTRRQSLKAIASSLLIPVLDSSIVAALGGLAQNARATDPACASCTTTESLRQLYANPLDSAAHLKRVSLPRSLLSMRRSTRAGLSLQYVESATGRLAFAVQDLTLRGMPAIGLTRYYNSAATDVGLGVGWSLAFEDRVVADAKGATLYTAAGDTVAMAATSNGYAALKPGLNPHTALVRIDASTLREVLTPSIARVYRLIAGSYFLSGFDHGAAGSIAIERDAEGRIQSIASSVGRRIELRWSQDATPRLQAISDNAGRSLRLVHTGNLLTGVVDVAGARWTYAYDDGGLTRIVDPEGTTILAVAYADTRVAKTTTIAGTLGYDYGASGTLDVGINGTRTVTFAHNADGQPTSAAYTGSGENVTIAYDDQARVDSVTGASGVHQYAYDSSGRPTLSAKGKAWKQWQYDAQGRIQCVTDPAGPVTYVYDDASGTLQASSSRKARAYTASYRNGRLIGLQGAGGSPAFAYTSSGQLSSIAFGKQASVQYEYDEAGLLLAEQYGSGYRASCVRNARGDVTLWADSTGRQFSFQRDTRGALVQITNAKGEWASAERDTSGRIVALGNSKGQTRRFTYDGNGALVRYVDALGRDYAVQYDATNGRAVQMTQTNGTSSIVRASNGDAVFVAGSTAGIPAGSESIDDGWLDPLGGQGLIGSFSGFSAYAATRIAATPGSGVPAALASMLVLAGDSEGDDDGDDDDDDDGDDDDDDGDDDDDDDDCTTCESTYTQTCDATQEDAYSSAQWLEVAADALCAATIETGPGMLLCLGAAEAAYQASIHTADTNHSNCVALIPQNCYSQCQ